MSHLKVPESSTVQLFTQTLEGQIIPASWHRWTHLSGVSELPVAVSLHMLFNINVFWYIHQIWYIHQTLQSLRSPVTASLQHMINTVSVFQWKLFTDFIWRKQGRNLLRSTDQEYCSCIDLFPQSFLSFWWHVFFSFPVIMVTSRPAEEWSPAASAALSFIPVIPIVPPPARHEQVWWSAVWLAHRSQVR